MLPTLSHEEILRYSRHLLIPEVGLDGQRKLLAASVLVIGHNPGLEMLAFRLTDPRAKGTDSEALERMKGKFPTAGLAILELPARSWHALEPASCRLIGFVRPRDLER